MTASKINHNGIRNPDRQGIAKQRTARRLLKQACKKLSGWIEYLERDLPFVGVIELPEERKLARKGSDLLVCRCRYGDRLVRGHIDKKIYSRQQTEICSERNSVRPTDHKLVGAYATV